MGPTSLGKPFLASSYWLSLPTSFHMYINSP